jgi:hypothetical protein
MCLQDYIWMREFVGMIGTRHEPPCRGNNDCAVSEVIGAVMLISIVVIAVAIIGVAIWSQPPPQKVPALSAGIANESCKVILTHNGGDTLEQGLFKIYVDTTDRTTLFTKAGITGPVTSWGIGETLVYDPSPPCTQPPTYVRIVFTGGNGEMILSSASLIPSVTPQQIYVPPTLHIITASASTGGSISPSGAVTVNEGADQTFGISPDSGYHITDVIVDGVSQGVITSYTFTSVETEHTITASFGLNPPAVSSIVPNTGLNITTISITNLAGTNFLSGATVKLNRTGYADIAGTSVTVVSPTQITCTFDLTGKTAGLWNVAVINVDGQSGVLANGFTIINPPPTVTSIIPATGLNTTTISITNLAGTNFLSGATVKLNRTGYADIAGTSVTVVSPTQITCTFDLTGKTAGLWNVAVTNFDGQSGVLANGFTITAPRGQIFYNNFDAGFTGWTTSGSVSRQTGTVPKNGTASIRVRNTGSMQRTISTSGYSSIQVTFAMAATGLEAGEYVEAAWYDGGLWTTLKQITYNGGENDNTLRYYSYSLPSGAENKSNFALRFRVLGSDTTDIGYIDDVWVTGIPI